MHDINGLEFREGCIMADRYGYFRRVVYVGKEKIITTMFYDSLQKARESEYGGLTWTQEENNEYKLRIVQYLPLGVPDSRGREVHDQDMTNHGKVFHAIKSINGKDSISVQLPGGWGMYYSSDLTILSRPTDPDFGKPRVEEKMHTINGKAFSESTIKEALRRYVE